MNFQDLQYFLFGSWTIKMGGKKVPNKLVRGGNEPSDLFM
jgi:hypothetical protein